MSPEETTSPPDQAPVNEPASAEAPSPPTSATPPEPALEPPREHAPLAASEPSEAPSEGPSEGDEDVEEPEGTPLGMLAVAAAPTGERKKRRRRRKRGGHKAEGGPDATAPKAEGEAAPGETAEATASTETEGGPAAEGEAATEGAAGEGDKKRDRKRKRKKHEAGSGPQREKPPFAVGEEVVGKVTAVMPEAIMIDVSGKALGIFDRKEIPDSELPAEGEKILGKVSNDGARGGLVVLTRDLNRWQKSRTEVEAAFAAKQPIQGLVTGVIKGGVEIDVDGLRGFAPASHIDLRLGADLHHLIGQRLSFDVVQFAKRGREFVLSRKAALEETARAQREEALKNLKVGEVVKGTVRSVTQFGAFVDVGGIDGLVHVSEASHVGKPLHEVFKVDDEVEVKILRVDEKGKVWLSRRAAEHDPWEGAAERYARGTRHKGKIVRLQPFGAFIELEPGIDGLMHVSDIPSPTRFHHPNEVLKVGEEIEVIVAQNDIAHRKIGLHVPPKEGEVLPEGKPPPRLALHQAVKCIVEAQEINGLVVRIVGQTGRSASAYITAVATGTPKGTDLRKAFPVGKELDAKIIELDRRGTKLSIKALAQDQERQSFRQYQSAVKQASKFGTFGDLLAKKGITK
jgi:small subunit ribosomal protein S1